MQKGDWSINTTEEEQFDYQAYMKEYTPDLGEIHRGPEARQKRREAEILNNRGLDYRDAGDYDRAVEYFTKAIELNPNYAIAYNNRGGVYSDKGDYDRALEDCNKAIILKPEYAEPYSNRGSIYRDTGEVDLAINDYDMAIQLKPDSVEAHYNRGITYGEKGDHDRAIEDYTRAIELKPDLSKIYYNRAEAWLHLREWEEAKADLMTARNMGVNIINEFRSEYANVPDFEQKYGVKLPADIAAMLTLTQA